MPAQTTDARSQATAISPFAAGDTFQLRGDGDVLDPALLRHLADLAETRGNLRFTPGGGVLFDKPLSRQERRALPEPSQNAPRFLDLPQARFHAHYHSSADFRNLVDLFTVAHVQPGYRLVVIPLQSALSAQALRALADLAETFGHATLRLTANVSIRLPNVPNALLRPLFAGLLAAGLLGTSVVSKAA